MSVHPSRTGKWEVRWRQGKTNRSRTFDRKGDAVRFDAEVRRQSQLGQIVPPRTGGETLGDFADRWFRDRRDLAPKTRKTYANVLDVHVDPYLGHLQLTDLRPQLLVEWQRKRLESGAGKESMAKAAKLLAQILDRAIALELMASNPARVLQRSRVVRLEPTPADPGQIERIRQWFLLRDRLGDATLVSVLAYVGLRPMEALALQWSDVLNDRLAVTKALRDGQTAITKTGRGRYPDLPAPVAKDLREWRMALGRPSGLIWPRQDGLAWRQADWNNWRRRWFDKAKQAAGLECFTAYQLRHTAASLFIASGLSVTEVANQLGHSPEVSTRTYQHLMEVARGKPMRPLDEWIASARAKLDGALEAAS
jgi:integrase